MTMINVIKDAKGALLIMFVKNALKDSSWLKESVLTLGVAENVKTALEGNAWLVLMGFI